MQVGFQPFGEIPHCFLRKEADILPLETDTIFSSVSAFFAVISKFFSCRLKVNFMGYQTQLGENHCNGRKICNYIDPS
jgi:hypothetical protein